MQELLNRSDTLPASAIPDEDTDLEELPESEQQLIWQRTDERDKRLAALSLEERFEQDCTDAYSLTLERGSISTGAIQRYLGTGYGKAARIISELQDAGVIVPIPSMPGVYAPSTEEE